MSDCQTHPKQLTRQDLLLAYLQGNRLVQCKIFHLKAQFCLLKNNWLNQLVQHRLLEKHLLNDLQFPGYHSDL